MREIIVMSLNYFDVGVIVVIIALGIRGGLRGFVAEMAGLVGLVFGLLLARSLSPRVATELTAYIAPAAAPTVAFVALVIGGMLLVGVLARVLQKVLEVAFAGWLDHLLGGAAGAAKGVLLSAAIAWGAVLLIPQFPIIRESQTIPTLLDFARWAVGSLNINVPLM